MTAPAPLGRPLDRHESWRADLAFWGLVGLVAGMLIAPLWFGPMPPTTDFGGHAQVVHGFARLADGADALPNIWPDIIERREVWWLPNLLVVRLAALMHPALDAIAALRLWSTVALLATVVGFVWCLETFGRSRWLVFLAMPIVVWHSFVGLGFVNYYFGLACLPYALALARRIGDDAEPRRGHVAWLAAIGVFAFFAHAFACFVVLVATSVVLASSARTWRRLFAGLALAPAAGLWLHWYLATMGANAAREIDFALPQKLEQVVHLTLDLFEGMTEEMVLVVLALALLFTFASGILWPPAPAPGDAPGPRGRLRRSTLLLTLAALLGVYFWLPTYIGDMPTAERTIPAFMWILFMLPRARPEALMSRIPVVAAIAASVVLAVLIGRAVIDFDDQELRPALALIGLIPEGSRAQCVDVQYAKPIFHFRPLDHGCDGLIAVRRDAFAGGGFADTTHAAVLIKPGRKERRLVDHRWSSAADLSNVEWLLARGRHTPPPAALAEEVAHVDDAATRERRYTLYRSLVAQREPPPFEELRGGPGGRSAAYDCPEGTALASVTVVLTKDRGVVQSVGAECARVIGAAARSPLGPTLDRARVRIASPEGGGTARRTLNCSNQRPVRGLAMRTGIFVDAVALACGPAQAAALWGAPLDLAAADIGTFRGGPGGKRTDLMCPRGMIATGLRVRSGKLVDALGIACRPLADLVGARAAGQ